MVLLVVDRVQSGIRCAFGVFFFFHGFSFSGELVFFLSKDPPPLALFHSGSSPSLDYNPPSAQHLFSFLLAQRHIQGKPELRFFHVLPKKVPPPISCDPFRPLFSRLPFVFLGRRVEIIYLSAIPPHVQDASWLPSVKIVRFLASL